jgi:hypothetical protein
MKKSLKITRALTLLFAISVLFISCDKDELKGGISIKFAATGNPTTKNAPLEGVIIESFIINIGEIELEFDDNDPLFATDSVASDIDLGGPFEIDLMKNGNPLSTVIAQNVELPQAAYDEIEFKFRESENPISMMLGKSIMVKGTINGTPFIFWTDEEIEVEIEFEKNVLLEDAQMAYITVTFDILSLFNPAAGGIDISGATDGNGNGIIEIYPEDPDGNEDLANKLWDRLEDITEAFEDQYDN